MVSIPNSVTSIAKAAFFICRSLTSVTIPNSVTSMGNEVFYGCSALTSAIIGNSVTSLDWNTFYGCSALTSVTIPTSVKSVGQKAFHNCTSLTSLTLSGSGQWDLTSSNFPFSQIETLNIGSGITSIGDLGVAPTTVNCYATTPPTCSGGTFTDYNGELHVPSSATAAYTTADYWKNFTNIAFDANYNVTLEQTDASLIPRQTLQLTAIITPDNTGMAPMWTTSDARVATVDANGTVTAVAKGECDITATVLDKTATCHVTVSVSTGVESVNVDAGGKPRRYNVLGQPVDDNYRGIVIERGRKILVP